MLIGEFSAQLGEKNRIALPKKLRAELSSDLIITRGYEGCAIVLDKERWGTLIATINLNPLLKLNVRDTKRYLLGGALEVDLDKQGRFVIPNYILDHIEASTDMVLLGVGEWVEVWSKEHWDSKISYLKNSAADIAERLGS